jgi:hypothetical protein
MWWHDASSNVTVVMVIRVSRCSELNLSYTARGSRKDQLPAIHIGAFTPTSIGYDFS